MSEELCNHCGAPRVAGYAACRYCKTPFVTNTQTNAIPCPRCNTLNELGAQRCVQCKTWIVVQCVFCHALTPHNQAACCKCGETFAGAPQRFAQRQQQQRVQQGLQVAGQVGQVAASVLGAAALAGAFSGGRHHHHDESGGFFDSSDDSTGAGLAVSDEDDSSSSGGGILDSLFGGSSSDDSGSFWDSGDD